MLGSSAMRLIRFVLLAGAVLAMTSPAPVRGQSDQTPPAADDARRTSADVSDPVLADILKAWDRTQQETTTLVASFTERKDLKLLAKPVLSRGQFYYQSPNRARWEYNEPDRKVFVITE